MAGSAGKVFEHLAQTTADHYQRGDSQCDMAEPFDPHKTAFHPADDERSRSGCRRPVIRSLVPLDVAAGLAGCGDGNAVGGDLVGVGLDGDLGGPASDGRPTWIR
jgi:hypothetical protein